MKFKTEGRGKLAAMAGAVAVLLIAAIMLSRPGREVVSEMRVSGTVIDLTARERPASAAGTASMAVARVELPDGGKARVFVPPPFPAIGARIDLKLIQYDNGDREVVGMPRAAPGH